MQILDKLDWNQVVTTIGVGVLAWAGYELRQWRLWWMAKHGGAPDASVAKGPAETK